MGRAHHHLGEGQQVGGGDGSDGGDGCGGDHGGEDGVGEGGAEQGPGSGGGAGLIRPGVVGEPKAGHEVLAAAVLRVHVAPLGACAVHSQAVALDLALGVTEGEGAALTPAVHQRGGGLRVRINNLTGTGGGGCHKEKDIHNVLHLVVVVVVVGVVVDVSSVPGCGGPECPM